MTNETNRSYKAITKEQIDALQLYRIDHHGNRLAASMVPAISKEGRARYISADELRTMYDNAPSVGEPFGEIEMANRLRFFRDLNESERIKVFKAFGLISQDYSEFINESTQMLLFSKLQQPDLTAKVAELEAKLKEYEALIKRLNDDIETYKLIQQTDRQTINNLNNAIHRNSWAPEPTFGPLAAQPNNWYQNESILSERVLEKLE